MLSVCYHTTKSCFSALLITSIALLVCLSLQLNAESILRLCRQDPDIARYMYIGFRAITTEVKCHYPIATMYVLASETNITVECKYDGRCNGNVANRPWRLFVKLVVLIHKRHNVPLRNVTHFF